MEITAILENFKKWKSKIFHKESFSRKFTLTLSGNLINLILQLALSPILSRIYDPEVYGIYAVFNAVSMNFALISSLAFTNAILKAPNKQSAIGLARLSIILSAIFSFLGLILMLIFQPNIIAYFGLDNLGWLILLIPLSSFIYNTNISLSSLNIFNHKISKDVTIITSTNIFNRIFNLGYGIITKGSTAGLVVGDILTKVLRVIWLAFVQIKSFKVKISVNDLVHTIKNYKTYPLYILPSSLTGLLSSQLPIFLFSFYFGTVIVGYFSFASSILLIPIQLFGNSSSSIFLKKATDTFASGGLTGLQLITEKFFWTLLLIGVAAYGLLMPFGELIFKVIFGQEWAMAGVFFSYLAFSYIIMIASQPLNSIFLVVQKENHMLILNIIGVIIRTVSLMPGVYYNDFFLSIKLFSLANFFYYLLTSLIVFKLLKLELKMFLIKIVLLVSFALAYFKLCKTYLL